MSIKTLFPVLLLLSIPFIGIGQNSTSGKTASCMNEAFDKEVDNLLNYSVAVISVKELKEKMEEVHIFDAREMEEYKISHIPGAQYIGYDHWDKKAVKHLKKDAPIVVYCSVGYRSEKIGEKLQKLGYTNVKNLYGSIFEWVNSGESVVNKDGYTTSAVHTYNYKWSKWIDNKNIKKVY